MMVAARASGVLYTVDPSRPDSNLLKVSSIWGLGEHLVSGEAAADEFYVDKQTGTISRRLIGRKAQRLVNLEGGGTRLERVPEGERDRPCLDDETVLALLHGLAGKNISRVPRMWNGRLMDRESVSSNPAPWG
jgi:pyruvate,water dikinase